MGRRCVRCVLVVWVAIGGLPAAAAAPNGVAYERDLTAFFGELDRTYPFFDVKGIRKGWDPLKKALLKKVKGCSSDEQFLGIVLDAFRYLRDGHIALVDSRAKLPAGEPEWYPGVSFMPATKERVIVMAASAGVPGELKPGVVVTRIDGKPARAFLEAKSKEAWERGGSFSSPQRARLFEYRIPLRGKKGEEHVLGILEGKKERTIAVVSSEEARGWPHSYNMPKDLTPHGRTCFFGKLASGTGYVYLRGVDQTTEVALKAAIAAHLDAKGWIVDLRGNGGGGYGADLFEALRALPRPVAALIDAGCFSAGETLVRDVVQSTGARILGETTAGSSSAKRTWKFPSGIAGVILPTRSRSGLGKPIEFLGIKPHDVVEAVPEEVAQGLNSQILRAEEYLAKQRGRAK